MNREQTMAIDIEADRSLTLICEHCGTIFDPDDARRTAIVGLGYARYGCPECAWTVRSVPPPPAERTNDTLTPAIVPIND